jgi:hypothetical protein
VSELDKVLIKSTKKMVEIRKQSDRGLSYAWPWLSFLFPIETVTTHTLVKVGPQYICRVDGTGSTSSIQMRDGWEPKPLGASTKTHTSPRSFSTYPARSFFLLAAFSKIMHPTH